MMIQSKHNNRYSVNMDEISKRERCHVSRILKMVVLLSYVFFISEVSQVQRGQVTNEIMF